MQKLLEGIHHFSTETFDAHRRLFQGLANGQRPMALFITCSDSRIVPNLLTQTDPGDLFLLRNAGNIVPPYNPATADGASATIEFAVSALGVTDIIVCGHSDCGAVKAILDPELTRDMPALRQWISHAETTRRVMREKYSDLSGPELLTCAVQENVLVQLEHLRTHPAVASAIARQKASLYGWVYAINTGKVLGFNPQQGQFVPLTEQPPVPAPSVRLQLKRGI